MCSQVSQAVLIAADPNRLVHEMRPLDGLQEHGLQS